MNLKSHRNKTLAAFFESPETEKMLHDLVQHTRLQILESRPRTLQQIEASSLLLKENIAYSRCLRGEAMRYVKYLQASSRNRRTVDWIKYFFNLADQDVKNCCPSPTKPGPRKSPK
jgi:hypothetical protein